MIIDDMIEQLQKLREFGLTPDDLVAISLNGYGSGCHVKDGCLVRVAKQAKIDSLECWSVSPDHLRITVNGWDFVEIISGCRERAKIQNEFDIVERK